MLSKGFEPYYPGIVLSVPAYITLASSISRFANDRNYIFSLLFEFSKQPFEQVLTDWWWWQFSLFVQNCDCLRSCRNFNWLLCLVVLTANWQGTTLTLKVESTHWSTCLFKNATNMNPKKIRNESTKLLGNFVPRGLIHYSDHLNQMSIPNIVYFENMMFGSVWWVIYYIQWRVY